VGARRTDAAYASSHWIVPNGYSIDGVCAALAACIAFGGVNAAQAEEGAWYIGANMPLMFIDDSEATSTTSLQQPLLSIGATVKSEHDTGYKFGGVLGYHLDSGIRIEGELFLARAEIGQITNTDISVGPQSITGLEVPLDPSGSAEQFGAMLNLWYDIETDSDWTPYVGAGLGLIRIDQGGLDYDEGRLVQAVLAALPQQGGPMQGGGMLPPIPKPSATDTAFAYQIGAGVGYALSETTTLHIGYRLQALNGLEFTGMNQAASVRAETDLRIHFLEIGIRQLF